ncbi:MAG: phage holin family protein [Synergistota bacterium]|nr:phage holin family protein [Synergistota bacterium]
METFANLIVSFFDLVEAEGRTLKEKSVLVIEGFLIMFFGVSLVIYGVFAVGAALYIWLSDHIGRPVSALAVAVLFLGIGIWLLSKGRAITHGKGGPDVGSEQKRIES